MEPPADPTAQWTRLDAALAVAGLEDLERCWAFLVDQRLLGNRVEVREVFARAVASARADASSDAPLAARVASRLRAAASSLTLEAVELDPDGARARAALEAFDARGLPPPEPVRAPAPDTVHCQHCGASTPIGPSAIHACGGCGEPPLDLVALTVGLGLSSATVSVCPRCLHAASTAASYCFYCGGSL